MFSVKHYASLEFHQCSIHTATHKPGEVFTTRLKDELSTPKSHGLARSHSSPNIAKMMQDEDEAASFLHPSVDRTLKPACTRCKIVTCFLICLLVFKVAFKHLSSYHNGAYL